MIGAGFSRCSSKHADGAKKLPLWRDFAKRLAFELDDANKDLAFSDPLRLAEEYRAYFGQTALNDLIRREIHDEAWQPGTMHHDLLSLPWSEVMTTNWDTLLERAAQDVHSQIYGVVSKQSDLSSISSPRIVKLHGSIGVTEQFIVAQEDYRKYPENFAAFVNFARQVFIENELCLLGFSGDDPNFLQWAGWVRDHLADHSRRIYLVGALNLSASNRKLLESINIAPVDLWDAVKDIDDHDLRHQQAIELFLKEFLNQKPKLSHNWEPTQLVRQQIGHEDHSRQFNDNLYAASLLERQIEILRRDREAYPGWLVCPPELQWRIQSQINDPNPNINNITSLEQSSKEKLLYEMAWQHTVTFKPVATWLKTELAKIADPAKPCAISKRQQLEVALGLLKAARQDDDLSELMKWSALLEKHALQLPESAAEVAYQQALFWRDQFDYPRLESVIEKIAGEDPIWKLKQASMLAEFGRFDEGERLISDAFKDLRARSRHDPNSIHIQSRLAWAHWMFRMVDFTRNWGKLEELPNTYKTLRSDPWDQITHIKDKVSKQQDEYFKNQESVEPLFEQGHYRDHSNDVRIIRERSPFFLLDSLVESVGLPLRWQNVNLLADVANQLVVSEVADDSMRHYVLAIRAAHTDSSTSIKECFCRISLACAPLDVVEALANRLIHAIEYWRKQASAGTQEQKRHAVDVIRVFIEVLARLVIRVDPEKAKQVFLLAMRIGQDSALRHHWLYEVIGHLANYSLGSIPSDQLSELLLDALYFPVVSEIRVDNGTAWRWPNPIIESFCERPDNPRFDKRILELIELVEPGSPSCTSVLIRLLPLARNGILKQNELDKLAVKIWGEKPDYKVLPNTGLFTHVLLTLPSLDRESVNALLYQSLFEAEDAQFFTSEHLSGLIGAATNKPNLLLPNGDQAVKCFDRLVSWRPLAVDDDLLGMKKQKNQALIQDIGVVLAYSIVPALNSGDITEQRYEQLHTLFSELDAFPVVIALSYFTGLNEDTAATVSKIIGKGIQARTPNEVRCSVHALYQWKELAMAGKVSPPPDHLISKMIYQIESGRIVGLHTLLWCAGEMVKKNWLLPADVDALADCLPDVFDSADYSVIRPNSREAVTASLIRETSVELAWDAMKVVPSEKLRAMLEAAKNDALPEVRFTAQQILLSQNDKHRRCFIK